MGGTKGEGRWVEVGKEGISAIVSTIKISNLRKKKRNADICYNMVDPLRTLCYVKEAITQIQILVLCDSTYLRHLGQSNA